MYRPREILRANSQLDRYEGRSESLVELADQSLSRDELLAALRRLQSPSQQKVLRLRYPLDGTVPLSTNEIGRLLRWSTERVRAAEVIGLTRLRRCERKLERFLKRLA